MAEFKGKNNLTPTSRLAFERQQYKLKAFPENGGLGPAQVVDFNFAERVLYGKVDREHNPVIPRMEFIRPLPQTNNNETIILAMNFVAKQFGDFQSHYERACRMNLVPQDDPLLSIIKAQRGFSNPIDAYRDYVNKIMLTYIENFLLPKVNQIQTFEDFISYFLPFMERMTQSFPVTLSGYQRSIHSSIFTSGLAIDIGNIDFGDDEAKQNLILERPSLGYYLAMAKQYGFSVYKHNPGVLVADLAGPGMKPYRQDYDLGTVEEVFSKQYIKTSYLDLNTLIQIMLDYYDIFVSMYPTYKNIYLCNNSVKANVYEREYNNLILDDILNNNKLYYIMFKLYIYIRNIEERYPFSPMQLDNYLDNALRIKKMSESQMFDYIDDRFKSQYTFKNGSLTSVIKKNRKKLDKEH